MNVFRYFIDAVPYEHADSSASPVPIEEKIGKYISTRKRKMSEISILNRHYFGCLPSTVGAAVA